MRRSMRHSILLIEALSRHRCIDAVDAWMKKNDAGMCRRLRFKLIW